MKETYESGNICINKEIGNGGQWKKSYVTLLQDKDKCHIRLKITFTFIKEKQKID